MVDFLGIGTSKIASVQQGAQKAEVKTSSQVQASFLDSIKAVFKGNITAEALQSRSTSEQIGMLLKEKEVEPKEIKKATEEEIVDDKMSSILGKIKRVARDLNKDK